MKKNRLGNSELDVSEIGLGCMSLGTEMSSGVRIVHEALEQGVTFFDTADLYHDGRNEEIVGEALKGRRSDVIIATKVGNRRIPGREGWVWDPSKAYIREAVKESLRRLQTDYIDLYQLHGGTMEDPIDETIEAFEELKREGVIRYYGISSIRPNVIREYVRRSNIVSVMSQYSILDRRPEESVLPMLEDAGVSMIARGPVAKGLLSSKGKEKASEVDQGYLDYTQEELLATLDALQQKTSAVRDHVHTAIRYALAPRAVATAIPGASSVQQLLQNVAVASVPDLTEEELEMIRSISRANRYEKHRI